MTKSKKETPERSRAAEEILEAASELHAVGILDAADYGKITMRHVAAHGLGATLAPLSGDQIRLLREHANMSQAVFARALNLTPGYLSQLEREVRRPTGAALALLDVVRRKGIEAIL